MLSRRTVPLPHWGKRTVLSHRENGRERVWTGLEQEGEGAK